MLKVVNIQSTKRSIRQGGLLFHILSYPAEIQQEEIRNCDAFVLTAGAPTSAILSAIRKFPDKHCYLKPVLSQDQYADQRLVDTNFESLDDHSIQKIRKINERIDEIKTEQRSIDPAESILIKCCQYLFTRNGMLSPFGSRDSKIGFQWPFLSDFIDFDQSMEALSILKLGEKRKVIQGTIQDNIHLCKSCEGNYLNFRESCPNCSSIDITPKDLVHHFVCAHVAPEETFYRDGEMQCPKCDRKMRHIGIDYDKPSTVYQCNCCDHQFQEAEMKASCIDCGAEQNLTDLREEKIHQYSLTAVGEEFARYGLSEGDSEAEEKGNAMSYLLFKIFARQELHRCELKGSHSYIGRFKFDPLLIKDLDDQSKKSLQAELSQIIQGYLLASDVLCAKSAIDYLFILTDYKEGKAKERVELVQENLLKLVADNLNDNIEILSGDLQSISLESLTKLNLS